MSIEVLQEDTGIGETSPDTKDKETVDGTDTCIITSTNVSSCVTSEQHQQQAGQIQPAIIVVAEEDNHSLDVDLTVQYGTYIKMEHIYTFLIVCQVSLLIASFSTDWSRIEVESLSAESTLFESAPVNLFQNIKMLWDEEVYHLVVLTVLMSLLFPVIRILMISYTMYMFCNNLRSTSTVTLMCKEEENNGSSYSDTSVNESEELQLSPWFHSSKYFPLTNSGGSNMKWAQSFLYFCSATSKVQFAQIVNSTLFYWVSSNEYQTAILEWRVTIKILPGYLLFNLLTYPAFISVILLTGQLIRWLSVYKRESIVVEADREVTNRLKKININEKSLEVLRETNEGINLAEPLLGNVSNVSDNVDRQHYGENDHMIPLSYSTIKLKLVYCAILLSTISWITVFIGCAKIYEVKYDSGKLAKFEEVDRRNVSFWELFRVARTEDSGSSDFARFLSDIFVVTFCFVVPTIWMICTFSLEAIALRKDDNGDHPNISREFYRRLYLLQRCLYVFPVIYR